MHNHVAYGYIVLNTAISFAVVAVMKWYFGFYKYANFVLKNICKRTYANRRHFIAFQKKWHA